MVDDESQTNSKYMIIFDSVTTQWTYVGRAVTFVTVTS